MKKKNLAFTLAEVLIVIGIIGVVAALTLPNLNHATGDKERVTRVKKIYSTLNEAFDRAQVVYGNADTWYASILSRSGGEDDEPQHIEGNNLFTNRISEFLKVAKTTIDDNSLVGDDVKIITLPDGMEFYIKGTQTPGPSEYYTGLTWLGYITVDIDGFAKGKGQYGVDNFEFDITDQGIRAGRIQDSGIANIFSGYFGHSRWILENDNADYLKANESGVCPNGVQLSWTQTSCN